MVEIAKNSAAPAADFKLAPEIAREYEAASHGAGIRFMAERMLIRIAGDDRVSFLHGMCTADIKSMKPGDSAAALFVTEHAHVIADAFVHAVEDDAMLLDIDRAAWAPVRAHLEKFLVADDVEMEEAGSLGVLDIEGPRAGEVAAGLAPEAGELPPWRHLRAGSLRIANLPRFGGPARTIIANRGALDSLAAELKNSDPAVCDLSPETLEIIRVEQGLARAGLDTGEKTLALEARMERAISFSKGCYVGQETIERATARGALKRRLFGLRIEGARMPIAGAPITLDGKEVGRLGSVVRSPAMGILGLAILHHSAWAESTRVRVADAAGDMSATVADPPFAAQASNQGVANANKKADFSRAV
jgi:folate-binding protein YgfZ